MQVVITLLTYVYCFICRHLSSQLSEMERVIGHMMRQDITEVLRNEIHRPLCVDHEVHIERHKLSSVTLGLLRIGHFDFLEGFKYV